ncbi:hypothetical protein SCALIN_C05_0062 [Candidatus Scalindua japonica]|uniref:Uncharacterized protein n=1 Tax=Candidatus Scalindua japonica TaxID=1284222 RepID=A0A286TVQ1_9BACT|nr:hypothetical protein SCALIN_C05_0062 [Candidatus Scalindua japonica]
MSYHFIYLYQSDNRKSSKYFLVSIETVQSTGSKEQKKGEDRYDEAFNNMLDDNCTFDPNFFS